MNNKFGELILEALKSRGFSDAESEQIINNFSKNIEEEMEEVIPGTGIFCQPSKQTRCLQSMQRELNEYKNLWQTWMERCDLLRKLVTNALEPLNECIAPFNEAIEKINIEIWKISKKKSHNHRM